MAFNENTRVKIPAILHMCRIGYEYVSLSSAILKDKTEKKSEFEALSSGEKQLIHSISSILYHIKNVDSINLKSGKLLGYRNINILLDEIELYYHPEMQRNYLAYLLKMIGKLSLSKIEAVNICLVTHSPYILSDIPNYFTLKLETGTPKSDDFGTFGANIHDLLANDFFMKKDGFMGEFAKNEIISATNFLKACIDKKQENENTENEKWNKQKIKSLISIIGEPLIKNSLKGMYDVAFPLENNDEILEEIERLRNLLR